MYRDYNFQNITLRRQEQTFRVLVSAFSLLMTPTPLQFFKTNHQFASVWFWGVRGVLFHFCLEVCFPCVKRIFKITGILCCISYVASSFCSRKTLMLGLILGAFPRALKRQFLFWCMLEYLTLLQHPAQFFFSYKNTCCTG